MSNWIEDEINEKEKRETEKNEAHSKIRHLSFSLTKLLELTEKYNTINEGYPIEIRKDTTLCCRAFRLDDPRPDHNEGESMRYFYKTLIFGFSKEYNVYFLTVRIINTNSNTGEVYLTTEQYTSYHKSVYFHLQDLALIREDMWLHLVTWLANRNHKYKDTYDVYNDENFINNFIDNFSEKSSQHNIVLRKIEGKKEKKQEEEKLKKIRDEDKDRKDKIKRKIVYLERLNKLKREVAIRNLIFAGIPYLLLFWLVNLLFSKFNTLNDVCVAILSLFFLLFFFFLYNYELGGAKTKIPDDNIF